MPIESRRLRWVGLVVTLASIAVALAMWWSSRSSVGLDDPMRDDAQLGTVFGHVGGREHAPLATAARVCLRERTLHHDAKPRCVLTDRGFYRFRVAPGRYELFASAAERQGKTATLSLSTNAEVRRDFTLLPGGVELRGIVRDLAGEPIVGALIQLRGGHGDPDDAGALAISDAQGRFAAWVRRGGVHVVVVAAGHARDSLQSSAPGPTVELHLMPESVLVGRLVDAQTNAPIPDVEVHPDGDGGTYYVWANAGWARSDAQGYFRIGGLTPGVYRPLVADGRWRGRAASTLAVGLGETSTSVEVPLVRGATVNARIVDGDGEPACIGNQAWATCERTSYHAWIDDDGRLELGGLAPGEYRVGLYCDGRLRAGIAQFEITAEHGDLDQLRWVVPSGLDVSGKIVSPSGEPLSDVIVVARTTEPYLQFAADSAPSDESGAFTLRGLAPGRHALTLGGSAGPTLATAIEIELRERSLDGVRIEVPSPGQLVGRVLDQSGAPVPNLEIIASASGGPRLDVRSDDAGRFEIVGLAPGRYRVQVRDPRWSVYLATREIEIEAGGRSELELNVTLGDGIIRGRVVDERGLALHGAFIHVEHQSERLGGTSMYYVRYGGPEERPTLTDADGSFELTGLPAGLYTVMAVAGPTCSPTAYNIELGASLLLRVESVASIAGRVLAPEPITGPITFALTAELGDGLFRVDEQWTNADGSWRLEGLPPGSYTLHFASQLGEGRLDVELAPGVTLEDQRIELAAPATVSGRVIYKEDTSPVVDAEISVPLGWPYGRGAALVEEVHTDAQGRFTMHLPARAHTLFITPAGTEITFNRGIDVEQPITDVGDISIRRLELAD